MGVENGMFRSEIGYTPTKNSEEYPPPPGFSAEIRGCYLCVTNQSQDARCCGLVLQHGMEKG